MGDLAVVTGLDEVNQMLDELPKVIVARAWLKALQAGAKVMEEYLISNTPEADEGDRKEDLPHLKDSSVIEITLDSQFRGGIARVGFGKMGNVALWVEYGHRIVGHKPNKKVLGQYAPHPFMSTSVSQAYEATVAAFQSALVETLTAEVPGFQATFAAAGGEVDWFPL